MVGFIVLTMFFTMRTVYLFRPPAEVQEDPQVVADSAAIRCVPAHRTSHAARCALPCQPAARRPPVALCLTLCFARNRRDRDAFEVEENPASDGGFNARESRMVDLGPPPVGDET
eukprot:COSAG06_NODE_6215_length_3045_cov_6.740140_1_plen_115_part_00